jgi:hypothetical protein
MKTISVIVVSFNTRGLLRECLESVGRQEGVKREVWVVDNHSEDGSAEMVEESFPEVKLIRNPENLGFAAANNQALRKAGGEYLLLLNSDTVLPKGVLATMTGWMEAHPEVGISTCRLIAPDGRAQRVGGFFPTLGRVILWMTFLDDLPVLRRRAYHLPPGMTENFKAPEGWRLDWVSGAFFLMRREVYEQIGGLDEDFFMYVEEVDYCLRAKKAGWQVAFVPAATITHHGGASSTAGSGTAILGEYRSLIALYEKKFPFWQLPLVRGFLKAGALLRLLLFGYAGRDSRARRIYSQAFRLA